MASQVISIESWKRENPDWMARRREDRPEPYRIPPTGEEETDRRRYAVMDDLWTWPEKIRERIVEYVRYELCPFGEERAREMWLEGEGLQSFEAARARTHVFSESRFWRGAKEHLDLIRDAAEHVALERRLGGYATVIAHHRSRISHLKLSLLLWMFRHGVRRLDPRQLRRVEIDELRQRLRIVEKGIRSSDLAAESAAAALELGTFRSGRNKGEPLTEVRRYSIGQERERALERAEELRRERAELQQRIARLEARGAAA